MNFTREQIINTPEYMNAIADGYKIFTEFNDWFMLFSVRKVIKGNRIDYPAFNHQQIRTLPEFNYHLKRAISEIQKYNLTNS